MNKIKIFCTLGPSSLNKKFLKYANGNVDLLRLNMSHLSLEQLKKNIRFIKKNSEIPICIDTEGAQIRTKVKKKIFYKKNSIIKLSKSQNFYLYPENTLNDLKEGDILDIGFEDLKIRIISKNKKMLLARVISAGLLETNKGVHVTNRLIKLDFLTLKDHESIKIGKENHIKNYALSFVNTSSDVKKFNNIFRKENKIFKIETAQSIKNLNSILKIGSNFLIDRGDLSKEIGIENIPFIQRKILKLAKKKKRKIFIATNFLESMINKKFPTRAEVNDIYNAIELGAAGVVLAAETAIGKYPVECIKLIRKISQNFKKIK
jgi:pyruvate kinase